MSTKKKALNLREIVVMASISVGFGVLYLLWIFFGQFIKGVLGPVAWGGIAGLWVMAPIVCAYIIRKPGVALIAELVAAGTEIMVGSVSAGTVLILGFTQGLGVEIALALFLWRSYRLPVLMLAGILGMVANFLTIYVLYGYSQYNLAITLLMLAAMLVSGALLGGWGSKSIADALGRTGVLNNFALGRLLREKQHGQSVDPS
ncbi:ECF transporter S component [Paenibacillus eucommiae]|uniref:Energy-coupling factor transport system substrate-specific component n=1 Tax=Paenibacillus eucommiae TaxID=1355755 RepID=A0ABS4IXB8_9BACL|nr:ECF transporter S component [Paenibacillus eucommiae]MBP1992173.1 energy-coupling factor transport system substrate-specific component [Paenibacillus eucommiae]